RSRVRGQAADGSRAGARFERHPPPDGGAGLVAPGPRPRVLSRAMLDGQDVLASLLAAGAGTWQLSDGRGALARGTRSGAPTRRGQALLAAPHVGPRAELPAVALLGFDDRVARDEGGTFELTPGFVIASRGDGARELAV